MAALGLCTKKLEVWHCEMLSKATSRMYDPGKAFVQALTSLRTWLGSLQPNMGSFHMVQYRLS